MKRRKFYSLAALIIILIPVVFLTIYRLFPREYIHEEDSTLTATNDPGYAPLVALNKQRWQSKHISSYMLRIRTVERWSHSTHTSLWTVTVVNDQTTTKACADVEGNPCSGDSIFQDHRLNIDELFAILEDPYNYPHIGLVFDPAYGFPTRMSLYTYATLPPIEYRILAFEERPE